MKKAYTRFIEMWEFGLLGFNCTVDIKFSQGIGTETPYLQVDGYTFSGKYVAPLGTYIIMEEKDPSSEGKCFFPLDFKQFFKTALVLCNIHTYKWTEMIYKTVW